MLPMEFKSSDDLRAFKSSVLDNDKYNFSVVNTKYHKVPFSKNGIDFFDLNIRKTKREDSFSSQIFIIIACILCIFNQMQ